jgi:hypothetical protein
VTDTKRLTGALVIAVGIGIGAFLVFGEMSAVPDLVVLLGAVGLLFAGLRYPEIVLALFVIAGEYTVRGLVDIDTGILLGAIVFILVLLGILRDGVPALPVHVALLVAVALVVLFGVTYSQDPVYGVAKGLRFATLGALAMAAPVVLLRGEKAVDRLLLSVLAIGVGLSAYALAVPVTARVVGRLVAFGGSPITLGRVSGVAIAAGIGLAIQSKRWRWLLLAGVPPLFVTLLGTGSRGPLVAAITAAGVVITGVLFARGVRKTRLAIVIAGVAIAVAVAWQFLPENIVGRYALLLRSDPGASIIVRPQMLTAAWVAGCTDLYGGTGTGSFGVVSGMQPYKYPHNMVAEVFAENGAVTVTMLLAALVIGMTATLRWALRTGTPAGWSIVFGVAFTLTNSMVSGDLNDNQLLFTLLAVAGVVAARPEGAGVVGNAWGGDSG